MPQRTPPTPLPAFSRDPAAGEPLHRQLYTAVREAILAGRLAPGARLPSTRACAADLGLSRSTAVQAFDQLLAEGYIETRAGTGAFVCHDLPDAALLSVAGDRRPAAGGTGKRSLSERGRRLVQTSGVSRSQNVSKRAPRPFRPVTPALDAFPTALWARLGGRRLRGLSPELLDAGEPAGYRPLREAIAAHLNAARGLHCDPEQVLIVGGSQQGLDLAGRVLLDLGDEIWMEEPGYFGAADALRSAGARLVPVPVDGEGLDVLAGCARSAGARLAYVTPSAQFPLGVTMSLARRLALLDWARRADSWIVEDDFGSEFRFGGRPLAALQGLDPAGRVIYVGSFSRVLFPALRLGYLVLPPDLVAPFLDVRIVSGRFSPLLEQAILADFIAGGHFMRHLRRMRRLYAARQAALVAAVRRWGDGVLSVRAQPAGMHLIGWLPDGSDDRSAARRAEAAGVETLPLSACTLERATPPGLLLGYAAFTSAEIEAGVRTLCDALEGSDRR